MKNILNIIAFATLCSIQSINIQAQVIRTWTGLGDGHSWYNAMNWNSVTCKYGNEQDGYVYQTGHVAPRSGEIVVFDNIGNLTITTPSIAIGNIPYTDYSEVVNNCSYGGGTLYSLQILNSNIIFVNTQVWVDGASATIPGYNEALKLQNSSLTCWQLGGGYAGGGSSQPQNMNSIYAENSTITTTWFQTGFFTGGRTYFSNCTINTPSFSPYSNNDFPDEIDEFTGCTINTGQVSFGPKCIAIATNCTFNMSGVSPGFILNWYATQNSVTLNNVQINVDANATYLDIAYKQGASIINGNINCNSADPNFTINFHNTSNTISFPLQLNGNLILQNGGIYIGNQGVLEITGNLEMTGTPNPNCTKDVKINNQTIFQIGGLNNFVNYNLGPYGPIPGGSRFGLKFSGSGDSHVNWPIGFPVDTLTIEKTGCGKVYIDNSPLHVTGKLNVKSGQLILSPQAGSNYSLVDGADLILANGGSLLLQNNANIAVAGNFLDNNVANNPATCNGFNNAAPNTVAFYNTQYTPVGRVIGSAGSTSLGNVVFINQNNAPFTLQNNITTNNFDLGNNGKVILGNSDFTINGILSNYSSSKYFVTNGTGSLKLKNVSTIPVFYPIGASVSSYTPLTLQNNGITDDFKARVAEGLFYTGNSGLPITEKAVNRTWFIEEATPGGSNANVTLQWNTANELAGFSRANTYLAHYLNLNWESGNLMAASGSNPYQLTRNNITTFSPFAVISELPAPNKILNLTSVFLEGLYNTLDTMRRVASETGYLFSDTLVSDQIQVELHNPSYSSIACETPNVKLGITGTSTLAVPSVYNGSYYITIKHRNHLETTSAAPVSFAGGSISYSFDAPAKAYGGNLKMMPTGQYVIYGGDVNQDGVIDTADMSPVDNDAANYAAGYLATDVNGDGVTDTADMTIVDNNAASYVGSMTP